MCAIIHFGADGWRARVDEDFTADNVARIADAVGELWQKTNPGKTHGLDAVLASRPVPTPALTWAAAYDGEACGALMVTGSHHPQGYLCLKIRMGDGSTANQDVIEELEETMAPEPTCCASLALRCTRFTPGRRLTKKISAPTPLSRGWTLASIRLSRPELARAW